MSRVTACWALDSAFDSIAFWDGCFPLGLSLSLARSLLFADEDDAVVSPLPALPLPDEPRREWPRRGGGAGPGGRRVGVGGVIDGRRVGAAGRPASLMMDVVVVNEGMLMVDACEKGAARRG